jgi:hypothetical protein
LSARSDGCLAVVGLLGVLGLMGAGTAAFVALAVAERTPDPVLAPQPTAPAPSKFEWEQDGADGYASFAPIDQGRDDLAMSSRIFAGCWGGRLVVAFWLTPGDEGGGLELGRGGGWETPGLVTLGPYGRAQHHYPGLREPSAFLNGLEASPIVDVRWRLDGRSHEARWNLSRWGEVKSRVGCR